MWEQHGIILDIVSAFEVCYFEDVILHIFRNAFNEKGLPHLFKDAQAESTVKNLTRNLHLLLSGSQFVLPPTFVENVIKKVHERYAMVIEKSSSKLGMSTEVMTVMSKPQSSEALTRSTKRMLHQAVDVTFLNKLKRKVLIELMDIKPKFGVHNNRAPRNLEDRSVFAFSCKTPLCELARSAGLLSAIPLEALPLYKCVDDDEYDSDGDGDGGGCGNEWNAADARPCRCYSGFNFGRKRLNPHIAFDLKTIKRLPFAVSDMTVHSYFKTTTIQRQDELKDFGFLVELDSSSAEGHVSSKSPQKSPQKTQKSPQKSQKNPESKGGGKNTRRLNIYYKLNGTKRFNRYRKHKTKKMMI